MTSIRFRVTRVPNLQAMTSVGGDDDLDDILGEAAAAMEAEAKRLAPVDTGRLRASIKHGHVSRGRWSVVAQTEYARFVEYGTRFQEAQPFMRPALRLIAGRLRALLRRR